MLTFLGRGSAFSDQHNSAFFETDGDLVIIDCSMSSFQRLNNWDLSIYDHIYVLVTHTHGDHISGIGMLIDLLNFTVKTPITVVAPSEEVESNLKYWLSNVEGCNDEWYELISCDKLSKEWFKASIATKHTEELDGKCFGYNLTIEGNNVVYTGDTGTLEPFEQYITPGTYLYTEVSAKMTPVHLFCESIHDKLKDYVASGVHVYLMHMDDEEKILECLNDTGAYPAHLDGEEATMEANSALLSDILGITDSLYKDMCMN